MSAPLPDVVTRLPERARVTTKAATPDLQAAEVAATALLQALGIDAATTGNPDLERTPYRLASAYAELLTPREFDFTTFANVENYDELVLVGNIEFTTLCEHHLLPFSGVAHVAYLPGERIVGLSKLPRLVEFYASSAQTQERLTTQIADGLQQRLAPHGVGVVITAEHTCMTLRGARARGSVTTTSSLRGHLRDNASARAELMSLVGASC